jgi:hypothetical protein
MIRFNEETGWTKDCQTPINIVRPKVAIQKS